MNVDERGSEKASPYRGVAENNKSNLPLINTDDTDLKKQIFTTEGTETRRRANGARK
jgi:hypothetical protein